jgi:hypothetical protein
MSQAIQTAWARLTSGRLAPAYAPTLAACLALAFWLAGAAYQFHFADEGYLWYDAQRTLAGEVPLRDFRSYDPLRYYWTAALMWLTRDDGLVVVNIACDLFGAIGMWIAMRLVFRRGPYRAWGLILGVAAGFITWAASRMHFYDVTASVMLVASLGWMLDEPSRRRCFLTGVVLGVAALIRRDHGLYGGVAESAALVYLVAGERRIRALPALMSWSAGVLTGYAPMQLAVLFVPGFWDRLWMTLHVYFEVGATNLPLPIPWPWRTPFGDAPAIDVVRYLLQGCLLLCLPLFGAAVASWAGYRTITRRPRLDPYLLAAGLLSLMYTHHAFARAGIDHLVTAAFPMLIGVYILVAAQPLYRAMAWAWGICALSLVLLLPAHPLYQAWAEGDWVRTRLGTDEMVVPEGVAARAAAVSGLVQRYAPPGREIAALPQLAGAYPITGRRAAVWDTYATFPADAAVQQSEISRLEAERPALVIIQKGLREGGPVRGYPRTHPLVYAYIQQHFTRIEPDSLPPDLSWEIYVPAEAAH